MQQASKNIMLVRPATFSFNTETANSNYFQNKLIGVDRESITKQAIKEFNDFSEKLKANNINVFVFNDTLNPPKPDAVFPNNWVSFHADGTVVLYPMCAINRRNEKRQDILEELKMNFVINNIVDLSANEAKGKFLEGTGSIIFDHINKIAYACLSPRTDKDLFIYVCDILKYKPVYFYSFDKNGKEIYHTNVMMCVGEKFAIICLESITSLSEKQFVINSLKTTGHQIVDISFEQMNNFAGNMLTVENNSGTLFLILSKKAFDTLSTIQKNILTNYCELLPVQIDTIETIGGGSTRCMMAELFCPEKTDKTKLL